MFGILVIAGSACMLLLLSWPVLDPEPSYQGKPLSAWLRQTRSIFRPIVEKDRAALKNAIRQMGTNAIPYLLKMAARRSSDFREELITLDRSHFHLFGGTYDSEYHEMAILGFSALGSEAKPAVPRLIKLLDHPDPEIAMGAAENLAAIGPEAAQAVPALLRVCQDISSLGHLRRMKSIYALGCIHENAPMVVPALLQILSETNSGLEPEAAYALGSFGTNAVRGIPPLRRLTSHPTVAARVYAAEALSRIDPTGSWDAAGPVLVGILESPKAAYQEVALSIMPRFGTNAIDAIPTLERFAIKSPFYSNSAP